jgi:hypothetical protein
MSTYTPIASQTLSSATSSVTFTSIPQGYTDLVLVINMKGSVANYPALRFNGDSGSNYSRTILSGNGSTAVSARGTSETAANINYNSISSSSDFNYNSITHIQNYSNLTTFKTQLTRANQAASGTDAIATLWRNTNAITQIVCITNTGDYASGSTFSLYGIQVGDKAQKAQGGNIVASDGTYMYHAFTSSGSFIPNEPLTADVLVIAGGGGSAGQGSGGGGAGGLVYQSGRSISLTTPVIVGAGGAKGGGAFNGNPGGNSIFDTITALGGAPAYYVATGQSGGSGSGAAYNTGTGGAATQGNSGGGTGYGNAGGAGNNNGNQPAGGGGGAGAAGGNATTTVAGNGGAGLNTWSSWASATNTGVSGYYAGGGGGGIIDSANAGTGGAGGGGRGGEFNNGVVATNGTPNTGGGAGGGGKNSPDGTANGGSGIVIIRYAL